jgi:hypothetical protein
MKNGLPSKGRIGPALGVLLAAVCCMPAADGAERIVLLEEFTATW